MIVTEPIKTEGLHRGRIKGSFEERLLIAKELLIEGANIVFVAKVTGITLEELKRFHCQPLS